MLLHCPTSMLTFYSADDPAFADPSTYSTRVFMAAVLHV